MNVFSRLTDFILPPQKQTVVAIGNFDGIHPGHQLILQTAVTKAKERGIPAGAFTFNTHPKTLLYGKKIDPIIPSARRLKWFDELGMDFCFMLEESVDFFKKTPDQFIQDVLCDLLRTRVVVVGDNFRFGFQAKGSVEDLNRFQSPETFELFVIPMLLNDGKPVSSSRIRKAIETQDFESANTLLNRVEFHTGLVVPGKKMGTGLGFPTANLQSTSMQSGVYAVRCWVGNECYQGLMNVGTSPTFGENERRCEIHLLRFPKRDLYGQTITFQILKRIRDEKKFSSKEELIRQIQSDIASFEQN